jgi:hypothetical protein
MWTQRLANKKEAMTAIAGNLQGISAFMANSRSPKGLQAKTKISPKRAREFSGIEGDPFSVRHPYPI